MKRLSLFLQLMAVCAVCVSVLAATTVHAAAPDAKVKGLWLTVPALGTDGKKVEVQEFKDDKEYNTVTYERSYDGMVALNLRRQPIEESELRETSDVPGAVEMIVNNEDLSDKQIAKNIKEIKVNVNAKEFVQRLKYPCATAQYVTGANEDTRVNLSLYIFTNVYAYIVEVSAPIDSFKEYESTIAGWFNSMKFVENK